MSKTLIEGQLNYLKHGTGEKVMLTFHGFGQTAGHFRAFDIIGDSHTLYYFDLPHHGDSRWKKDKPFRKSAIHEWFDQFLKSQKIENFSIAAYSLGAKFLLALLEFYPERISSLILIAPDGFRVNMWYKLATSEGPPNWLFKYIVGRPSLLFVSTRILQGMGLLDRSIERFVYFHMDTAGKRSQVYKVWRAFKLLRFRENEIINLINTNQISSYLYLGRHDRVIKKSRFDRFFEETRGLKYIEINCGHNHLIERVAERIEIDLKE